MDAGEPRPEIGHNVHVVHNVHFVHCEPARVTVVGMVPQQRAEVLALPGRHPGHKPIAAPAELILVDFLVKAP